jgi:hypothetical protein
MDAWLVTTRDGKGKGKAKKVKRKRNRFIDDESICNDENDENGYAADAEFESWNVPVKRSKQTAGYASLEKSNERYLAEIDLNEFNARIDHEQPSTSTSDAHDFYLPPLPAGFLDAAPQRSKNCELCDKCGVWFGHSYIAHHKKTKHPENVVSVNIVENEQPVTPHGRRPPDLQPVAPKKRCYWRSQ